jgi:hypothetical protein
MKYNLNVLKTDIGSFRHYWRGIPKIGKTSLYRDLVLEVYGDAKFGLLISPGNETGYKSLSNLYAVETPTWESFVEIVDDLVEHKEDNSFKIIAIDTCDELVSIASDKTLKVHFQRKNEKAISLNGCFGGFGAGHKYVQDLINDQIRRLESANYGLVFISHTKLRDIKEKGIEEGYQQLTTNLESRFDRIFLDKSDIVATFYTQKTVKDKELVSAERYIYFRSDGFIDAGSRFANMPEKVVMSAKNYLDAFNQGVKSSFPIKVTDKQLEEMRKVELEENELKAQKYIEQTKAENEEKFAGLETADDYKNAIEKKLLELDDDTKKQKRAEFKDQKLPMKFKEIDDIEVLKKILKVFFE